jgi:hypothetical protein
MSFLDYREQRPRPLCAKVLHAPGRNLWRVRLIRPPHSDVHPAMSGGPRSREGDEPAKAVQVGYHPIAP